MIDVAAEETRAKLLKDIMGERRICLLLSELLGGVYDKGIREEALLIEDALGAASRIAKLLSWSIEETERAVESGE